MLNMLNNLDDEPTPTSGNKDSDDDELLRRAMENPEPRGNPLHQRQSKRATLTFDSNMLKSMTADIKTTQNLQSAKSPVKPPQQEVK